MTSIPFASHVELTKATAPYRGRITLAMQNWSFARRLLSHAAKLVVDTRRTVWYYKGTNIEIAFSEQTGFVLMDHVRKLRSPGLATLSDAIAARDKTLKELANAPPTAETETSGLQAE